MSQHFHLISFRFCYLIIGSKPANAEDKNTLFMNPQEFTRLRTYQLAQRRARMFYTKTSKRKTKSIGNATGQILASSRLTHDVSLNKMFPAFKF